MDLELGLKVTKTIDGDDVCSTDFRIVKGRSCPLFLSQETETMFILTAHLEGYKSENIRININEDGTLISISGEKPVHETVMKQWLMYKKEPEIRGFEKVFKIPRGVILDKIKAKYNEAESCLKINMPKINKGIVGQTIKEYAKEKEDTESKPMTTEPTSMTDHTRGEEEELVEEEEEDDEVCEAIREDIIGEGQCDRENGCEREEEAEKLQDDNDDYESGKFSGKMSKLFGPCFLVGSALVASLVVMVLGLVRSKRRQD